MISAKSFRIHIYPNDKQARIIDHTVNGMRFVWNTILEYKLTSFRHTEGSQVVDVDLNELVGMHDWLKSIPRHILYQEYSKAVNAFNKFIHRPLKYLPPHYHSKYANVPVSYNDHTFKYVRFRENPWRENASQINLPRLGYVDMYKSPEAKISQFIDLCIADNRPVQLHHIKISRNPEGKYFATIIYVYEDGVNEYDHMQVLWGHQSQQSVKSVGINDVNPSTPLVFCQDSDGSQFKVWKSIRNRYRQLSILLKTLEHKRTKSKRFYKTLHRINVISSRLERTKRSFAHMISTHYASNYQLCSMISNVFHKRSKIPYLELHTLFRKYMQIKITMHGSMYMEFHIKRNPSASIETLLLQLGMGALNY